MKATRSLGIVLYIVLGWSAVDAYARPSTAFTYQGQLKHSGQPVSGRARFQFSLWDAESDGREVAEAVGVELDVTNGLFTAQLDFGITGRLSEPRRIAFLQLLVAGTMADVRGQLRALRDLGALPRDTDLDEMIVELELDRPALDPTSLEPQELIDELQRVVKGLLG